MIIVLSPAKSLDFDSELPECDHSALLFPEKAEKLVGKMKKMSVKKLKSLMDISEDLAQLNADRFQTWQLPITTTAGRPAVFAFTGDVYQGMEAKRFNKKDLKFAQQHVRILSGLYGVLRPLDLMLPYRLEMGTKVNLTAKVTNLYQFWGDEITNQINDDLNSTSSQALVNLASNEYFKSIKPKKIVQPIITPEFRDWKNGEYKMIGFFAKKARGMMARYIVKNQLTDPEKIKGFSEDGYTYNDKLSKEYKWVFTRENNS